MGQDDRAVADPQLRVHEASVLPKGTSANTNAPILMIA